MRMTIFGIALILGCVASVDAQSAASPRAEADIRARIASLTARLDYREGDRVDQDRYYDEMGAVTARLRDEIDGYIETVVDPGESSEEIAARVDRLLSRIPHPEYGDKTFAQVANLPAGRVLMMAYTVVRPPHHNWATIRGYLQVGTRFKLVSPAADDFDGYNMFKHPLQSPQRDELWLMAWGQAEGANGKIVRSRIYAFDGLRFRTVWAPDDLLDAVPSFSASGFTVEHRVTYPPYSLRDEYALSTSGAVQIR